MPVKKAPQPKSAKAPARRAGRAPRARRSAASAPAPTPAAWAQAPESPERALTAPPARPKPFPAGRLVVVVLVLAALLIWGRHHAQAPSPAAAPAPAQAAPAPAPVAAAPQPAHARPASTLRHRREGDVLALGKGRTLHLRCWRSQGGQAELDVFGDRNRRVRSLQSPSGPAGWVTLPWDGKDDAGKPVPAGRYFALPSQRGDQLVLEVRVKG